MSWSFTKGITRRLALVALAILLSGISGCLISYDADGVELSDAGVAATCADGERSLTVLTPAGDYQLGPNAEGNYVLEIRVRVCGVLLVDHWGQANVEGEGHLTVGIDGVLAHNPSEGIAQSHFGIQLPAAIATLGDHILRVTVRDNELNDSGITVSEVNFTIVAATTE